MFLPASQVKEFAAKAFGRTGRASWADRDFPGQCPQVQAALIQAAGGGSGILILIPANHDDRR